MSNWHKESFNYKIKLIYDEWLSLNCSHITLSSHLGGELESLDKPVDRDGVIEVYLWANKDIGFDCHVYERLSFRSIHADNKGYIRHVLRTMALNLAKNFFNINKVVS